MADVQSLMRAMLARRIRVWAVGGTLRVDPPIVGERAKTAVRAAKAAILDELRREPPGYPPPHLVHRVQVWSDSVAEAWAWSEFVSWRTADRPCVRSVAEARAAVYERWRGDAG